MKIRRRLAVAGLLFAGCLWITGCGGSLSSPPPQNKITPTVTVTPASSSINSSQSLSVSIAVIGTPTPTGTVSLTSGSYSSGATALANGSATITIPANTLTAGTAALTASYTPDTNSSFTYNSATGTASVKVTTLITPTVSVTPALSSITVAQSLSVTVSVSSSAANPVAITGSVTLSSGTFTSAAATLSSGSTTITIPASTLAAGTATLTATYSPDTNSSSTYSSATGTASVKVTALTLPTVTVTPGSSSVTTTQPLSVTVSVAGGSGNPTPTGSVTLVSGSYNSSAITLTNGSASINIPANTLAAGTAMLTATYTPDMNSSPFYLSSTGNGSVTVTAPATYVLTVDSASPSAGFTISVSPADMNGHSSGTTPYTLTYNAGTLVTLSTPASYNGYTFVSWTGCTPVPTTAGSCDVVLNSNTTVTANYNQPTIISVTVTPTGPVTIGTQQQFTATVTGTNNYNKAVTWKISAPNGMSPGDITSTGLYNTPYPAPASITVTATSVQQPSIYGSATIQLVAPSVTGPALTVDVNTPSTPSENPHTINPYIYGMNAYVLDPASQATANPAITRWGGDNTSRYNYQNTWSNSAADWYFENSQGTGMPGDGTFNSYVSTVHSLGAAALGSVPVNGWVSNGVNACGFPRSSFPNQVGQNGDSAFQNYNGEQCGYGAYPDGDDGCTSNGGCSIYVDNTTSDPTAATTEADITSIAINPPDITASSTPAPGSPNLTSWAGSTWDGGWVSSLVSNPSIGPASSSTGVQVWDLDNEPTWWSAVHRDVHPYPFTYDEVTNHGIGTALAIKTADPSAQVSGPVIDYWWGYFYSMQDIWNGWSHGPCYQPWDDPADREAHSGTALIEYYLQQFNKYSQQYGVRLLDYVDVHGYFAGSYNGNSVAFTTAGDTQEQEARMNSTRVLWDPTYTDPNYPQPNYVTDSNYTTNCNVPLLAPQLVRTLNKWVANDYPGTQAAIDEYNFGGLESINGAVVEADVLGIFGREGLGMGAFWPTTNYNQQIPGNYAFAMYRNYDGKDSLFGDTYLYATSATSGSDAEGQLAVYGAQRSSDNAITVMVINKTYGPLSSTLSLENFTATGSTTAQVYQYSSANLNAVVPLAAVAVTPPSSGTTSTISYTFPAQSITLLVIPQ
jgi:polyisoprenoid-binding protein YceI